MIKKIALLLLTSLFMITACKKVDLEKEYMTITHDANKLYIEFTDKTSEIMINLRMKIEDKSYDLDKTIGEINKTKDFYINKYETIESSFKNDISKQSIELKKLLVRDVCDNTVKTLEKFKNLPEKNNITLNNLIKEEVEKTKGQIQQYLDKDFEILKEIDNMVNR